jgi:hypothetical protein
MEALEREIADCGFDLKLIEDYIMSVDKTLRGDLARKVATKYENEECIDYMKILWSRLVEKEDKEREILSSILEGFCGRSCDILDESEFFILMYSLIRLNKIGASDRSSDDITRLIERNYEMIKIHFPKSDYPFLHPVDAKGRPPPPGARRAAPPKPTAQLHYQLKQPKRALPGYASGEMVAEYARKHNI